MPQFLSNRLLRCFALLAIPCGLGAADGAAHTDYNRVAVPNPQYPVDGVISINQSRALAGGVTPGDGAGFPVTITQSGSYRLSGNLTIPDLNTGAIQIMADFVTLDLNGFSIAGPVVCTTGTATTCPVPGTGI